MEGRAPEEQVRILLLAETNFIVGRLLRYGDAFVRIHRLAQQRSIILAPPELSLREAAGTLANRHRRIREGLQSVLPWLNEVRREEEMRAVADALRHQIHELVALLEQRHARIPRSLEQFAAVCLVIPHTPEAHIRGHLRHVAGRPPFKETDCEIFEAILQFLSEHAAEYTHIIFLNLDREDFDHPEIREELSPFNVELYFAPGEVIGRIRQIMGVV